MAEHKKVYFAAILLPGLLCLSLYGYSAQQTNQTVEWVLNQPGIVSLVAIFQVFEAVAVIFLTIVQLKDHYKGSKFSIVKWIPVWPSAVLVVGLFFVQTYLFLQIDGFGFLTLAVLFFLGLSLLLFLGVNIVKYLIKDWGARAEVKILIALFQILLAMFLPLIVKGTNVPFTQLTIEGFPVVFTTATVLAFIIAGYILYKKKNNKSYYG